MKIRSLRLSSKTWGCWVGLTKLYLLSASRHCLAPLVSPYQRPLSKVTSLPLPDISVGAEWADHAVQTALPETGVPCLLSGDSLPPIYVRDRCWGLQASDLHLELLRKRNVENRNQLLTNTELNQV